MCIGGVSAGTWLMMQVELLLGGSSWPARVWLSSCD